MDLEGKKVIVVGTGISGIGAVELLNKVGAAVILYDGNDKLDKSEIEERLPENVKAEIVLGALEDGLLNSVQLAVISPGVPIDSPVVNKFNEAGITVWGEIELAYNYEKGIVAAITGTNGKTTTTTLVGEIVKAWGKETFVVGNIGNSYTSEVLKTNSESITVAEISSFQLETVHRFRPKVSAILNITPDHLNRHYTMENYAAVKERIASNQTKDDFIVLNYDDEVLRKFGEETTATPVYFSRKHKVSHGTYLEGTMIKYTDGTEVVDVIDVRDMLLFGAHNHENVMAAAAICIQLGAPVDVIASTIRNFKAVEHRIEYVRTLDGVEYYNDSKGTNPDSTIKAIEAMPKKTILIAGGYDKHSEFDEMIKAFKDTIIELVLLGVTKDKIAAAARAQSFENIRFVESLKEAVEVCRQDAKEGQIVLLSPACASWDMFKSYEERGKLFKQYVNEL